MRAHRQEVKKRVEKDGHKGRAWLFEKAGQNGNRTSGQGSKSDDKKADKKSSEVSRPREQLAAV